MKRTAIAPFPVALATAVLLTAGAGGCTSEGSPPGGGATAAPTTGAPTSAPAAERPAPAPAPQGPAPQVAYNRLEAVSVGQAADFGGGVYATVTKITPVDLEGQGPGTTAGPGVDVTIELRNGSTAPVDLVDIAITAAYGPDATPAVPVRIASGPPLKGVVEPGASATGNYAFRLPADQVATLAFELTSSSAPNVITVRAR